MWKEDRRPDKDLLSRMQKLDSRSGPGPEAPVEQAPPQESPPHRETMGEGGREMPLPLLQAPGGTGKDGSEDGCCAAFLLLGLIGVLAGIYFLLR
jgi:hypothetical protein